MSVDAQLSGRQKAAVLLISLGSECSAGVLKQLHEHEIEQLALEVVSTNSVTEEVRHQVLVECYGMGVASKYFGTGGADYAEEILREALGDDRASEMMSRLAANLQPGPFDFLRGTDPAQLASFIQDEQPQAVALILAHLPPSMASRVLASLPTEIQADVAMRIATMERTAPEIIEGVERVLRHRLSAIITNDYSSAGGVDYLVKLLTNSDRGTERIILEYLDQHNPELADEVRQHMFVFDNLTQLDDHSLQRVLREVDSRDLSMALRVAGEHLRERVYRNLSTRAATMLREDMEVAGPVRVRQVEEAQQRVATIVRQLEEAGDIVIQRGTEDVLV
jgi:flagellar motor switch protein FliG